MEPKRQIFSLWASQIFEKTKIKNMLGLNLAMAVFFVGVIGPQTNDRLSLFLLNKQIVPDNINVAALTETTLALPLTNMSLSQSFSSSHPALDLVAPLGTPIYALEDGTVERAGYSLFGYGQHVVINHENHMQSLYAHLSSIAVAPGQKITRGELIGKVGSTGFATGNHLHLEISYEGNLVNPLEVLPNFNNNKVPTNHLAQKKS